MLLSSHWHMNKFFYSTFSARFMHIEARQLTSGRALRIPEAKLWYFDSVEFVNTSGFCELRTLSSLTRTQNYTFPLSHSTITPSRKILNSKKTDSFDYFSTSIDSTHAKCWKLENTSKN